MIRRGFLGGLMGVAAITKTPPAVARQAQAAMPVSMDDAAGISASPALSHGNSKWDAVQLLYEDRGRRERINNIQRTLLHGHYPSIASNHSWAPWFKAYATARRVYDEEEDAKSFWDRCRRKIFG